MARLGKGFESLIPTDFVDEAFDSTSQTDKEVSQLMEVPLMKLYRDEEQPRRSFDMEALEELAESIKEHGVLQPIVVTRETDGYKIVAGERRFRAAKIAGLTTIPAIVRTMDGQRRLELSVIENAQREDLNAIELATAYAKLVSQFNLSVAEVAKRVGKKEASIENTMRLLNLPEDAKKTMVEYNLSEGVMRPLVAAEPELIAKALPLIIAEGWTARRVERFIAENKKKSSAAAIQSYKYAKQEDRLTNKYNARFKVRGRSITITCKNLVELEQLLARLDQE